MAKLPPEVIHLVPKQVGWERTRVNRSSEHGLHLGNWTIRMSPTTSAEYSARAAKHTRHLET